MNTMRDYLFDTIKVDHQITAALLGPLIGAALGFFITMSKTLFSIQYTVYGAFLGLLGTIAYKVSLATNETEEGLGQQRPIKARVEKMLEEPISRRTRSQTASL
jgi:hypothetical protein